MGITLLKRAGVIPMIITGRTSSATTRRAQELGIKETHQGVADKLACLEEIAGRYGITLSEIAFVGDDLSDLGVLGGVGLPIAVANAIDEVKRAALFVTVRSGGSGAIREACEHVLRMNGRESFLDLWQAEERTRQKNGQA
jgi:YrbI family 3-deoxy-D-manno-octulosonate 8-phosphate phosphatase